MPKKKQDENSKDEPAKITGAQEEASGEKKGEAEADGPHIKRFYRSRTDRMIAGVCGGLGEYFNIDPTLVRIFFVLSIFAGFGFPAYIIAWIIVPEGPEDEGIAGHPSAGTNVVALIIGGLLVMIGLGMIADRMHYWYFMPDWFGPFFSIQSFFALALIAAGIFFILYMFRNKPEEREMTSTDTEQHHYTPPKSRTLYRSRINKKIAGVCGGIGEYFNIDPTFIRIFWVIFSLWTALFGGIILYAIMAIVIPERPFEEEPQ